MTSPNSSPSSSPDTPGVPFPPPLIFLGAMGIGLLAHWIRPVAVRPPAWWGFGALLVLFGVVIMEWSAYLFRKHKTAVFPWKPTRLIVTSGPYSQTRNPIYLGFALIQLGIGVWSNRLAVVLMVIPAIFATNAWIIAREESYLERKFGEPYRAYLKQVRRWI